MNNRISKTVPMLFHKIKWSEVAKELGINVITLQSWRKSGDENKNEAIDIAVNQVINKTRSDK